jgi:ankyrin repeat protein
MSRPSTFVIFLVVAVALAISGCASAPPDRAASTSPDGARAEDTGTPEDPQEQLELAFRYMEGDGVPQDPERAMELLLLSAGQDYAPAHAVLAQVYAQGIIVERDLSETARWMESAANLGLPGAQYNMGIFYRMGDFVPLDNAKAVEWFRKAAEQDFAIAQFELGLAYLSGMGVREDLDEGIAWLKESALNDFPEAHQTLGEIYDMLDDSPFPRWEFQIKAHAHLSIAAERTDDSARANEARQLRARIAADMRPEDLAEAESYEGELRTEMAARAAAREDGDWTDSAGDAEASLEEQLIQAVRAGSIPDTRRLLAAGADPDATNGLGKSALYLAAESGYPALVDLLIEVGATLDLADGSGKTPLMAALINADDTIAVRLIDAGANVTAVTQQGNSVLIVAAQFAGSRVIIDRLVDSGADVLHRDQKDATALHVAASHNPRPEITQALIDAGAPIEARDSLGWTALHEAAAYNSVAVIRTLLEAGAPLEARTDQGATPLFSAVYGAQGPDVVGYLVDAGADPGTADIYDQPAIIVGIVNGAPAGTIEVLLANGAPADQVDSRGGSFLVLLVGNYPDSPGLARLAIRNGADPNRTVDNDITPLMVACALTREPEMVLALLDGGADPAARASTGETAWDLARSNPSLQDPEIERRLKPQ